MPVTFQLNGQPFVQPGNPGLASPVLKLCNQQADTLSFTQRGVAVAFDADPAFAFNSRLVLTRDPGDGTPVATVFVGTIQEIPRKLGLEETISYVAHGPWQWLSTYAYLQTYNLAENPTDVTPTLEATYMGRVVLAQAPEGTSENLDAALIDIITFAIGSGCPIKLGVINGLNFAVPWDEITDLTCDQAISRLLQSWAPDAVVWWDYTTLDDSGNPCPTFNIDLYQLYGLTGADVSGGGGINSLSAYPAQDLTLVSLGVGPWLHPQWCLGKSGYNPIDLRGVMTFNILGGAGASSPGYTVTDTRKAVVTLTLA